MEWSGRHVKDLKMEKMKVGLVGCGNICDIYFQRCGVLENIEISACADIIAERARDKAAEYNIPKACRVEELLGDGEIGIVLNLTVPQAHFEIDMAALEAGKHVYSEKPLAASREEGAQIIKTAKEKNLQVGCAPDTFLGGGIQTCRKLIDDGAIGKPIAANAFMMCRGHEHWHPDPEFYYKEGGGPMLDMGPYYLTAMVNLMGPVKSVMGSTAKGFGQRVITSKPLNGTVVDVEVVTHVVGILNFASGAVATIVTSFDIWHHTMSHIDIYGTEGSLKVPDPNEFCGPVLYRQPKDKDWKEAKITHGYTENFRGIGLADMAAGIANSRAAKASGELGYHVLDIMHAIHESHRQGRAIELDSGVQKPDAMPVGLKDGQVPGA